MSGRAMTLLASIFLDFNLPNAATWFYFSLMLAIGLFFKFNRVFSVRNLDVLTLYLLVPGFLLLMEAEQYGHDAASRRDLMLYGFTWLIAGSLVLFVRCLLDLTLVSRPALTPNLSLAGLAWLAGALFI